MPTQKTFKTKIILLSVELAALSAVFLWLFLLLPLKQYYFSYTDFTGTLGEQRHDPGVLYIDDAMELSGTFGTSPAVRLTPGTYSIQLSYDADADGSTFHIINQNAIEGIVLGNYTAPLAASEHHASLQVWLFQAVSDFIVKATFSGSGSLSIYSVRIQETYSGRCLIFAILLFLTLLADIPVLFKNTIPWLRKNKYPIFFLAIVVLFASYPLLNDYLFESSDMKFHLRRIYGIKTALLHDHQFPVRILTNCIQGYGYPVSIFYGDLFLYFPAFLCTIGMPLQTAYKIYVICIHAFTAFLSYFCFSRTFKNKHIGIAGAFLYTLSPYRISTLYIRAALGEFTAMTFLPLVFYGLWKVYRDDIQDPHYKKNWLPLALGLSGIIQCHVLSCTITGLFMIFTCLILWKLTFCKPRFYLLCKAAAGTICLNAWFLVPFIHYMVAGKYSFHDPGAAYLPNGSVQASGLNTTSLFSVLPVYRTDVSGGTLESSLLVPGFPFLLILFIFFMLYMNDGSLKRSFKKETRLFAFLCLLSIYLCTCYFPYSYLQKVNGFLDIVIRNLQFPYRFLTIFSLLATVLFCLSFRFLLDYKKELAYAFCCLILLLSLFQHGNMMEGFIYSSSKFQCWNTENADMPRMGRNDYLPIDTDWAELSSQPREPAFSSNVTISSYEQSGTSVTLACENSGTEEYIEIPLLYYTGYSLGSCSDSDALSLVPGTNHKIRILFHAPYSGQITVHFSEPWYWRLSELITFLALLSVLKPLLGQKKLAHYRSHEV